MQYPIIDLITSAYINNGWTGLELTYGKNLFPQQNVSLGIPNARTAHVIFDFPIPSGSYKASAILGGTAIGSYGFQFYNKNNQIVGNIDFNTNTLILTDNAVRAYIYMSLTDYNNGLTRSFENIQIERGNIVTPYEPYAQPTTDIDKRLKLPMIHYFPHPVIDALQRAAAGTQTADDTEILQHYLTPLGIGGI